jgi:hypothetical protein
MKTSPIVEKVSAVVQKVVLIVFILGCLSIGAAILSKGWYRTWSALQVPTLSPIFADMRTVQGSLRSMELGFNPQLKNPGDPWARVLDYPMIWYWIARLFQLDNETNYVIFICAYILAFLVCCFILLRKSPSIFLLLAIFSWPSLLAVERGNNDLLAFVLIFVGVYLSQSYFGALSILLATVLKIFPVLSVISFLKRPKIFIPLLLVIAGIFLFNIGELRILQAGNSALTDPASVYASYGVNTNMKVIQRMFYGQSTDTYNIIKCIFILFSFILIVILSRIKSFSPASSSALKTDLFMAGGLVFSGTYLITSNWDYRLIFLLLCIPYILSIQSVLVRYSTLIGILLSANAIVMWSTNQYLPVFGATSKYYVFIIVTACLVREVINHMSAISLASMKTYFKKLMHGFRKKEIG